MRARACVVALLTCIASAAQADTLPSRALVLQYLSMSGTQDAVNKTTLAFGKDLIAKGFPGGEERVNELLASTVAWSAIQEDYISLIQQTYTSKELEALIDFSRSPMGMGIAAKNQQFALVANAMMMKRSQLLESKLSAAAGSGAVTMDKPSKDAEFKGVTYVVPPSPVYPVDSRAKGEEGVVSLHVLVGPNGDAEAVGVRKSSGFPSLDEAALAALAKAKFRPYVENGVPVRVYAPATLTFHLEDGEKSKPGIPFTKKKLF